MTDYPTGTVTFLMSDIEGSTTLWERHAAVMGAALAGHDALVESAVDPRPAAWSSGPRGEGDSRFAVFEQPAAAVPRRGGHPARAGRRAGRLPVRIAPAHWPPHRRG